MRTNGATIPTGKLVAHVPGRIYATLLDSRFPVLTSRCAALTAIEGHRTLHPTGTALGKA